MALQNVKKIFVAAGVSVMTGVLVLGANQAFGLDYPTQDPSTGGLVSPTFGGIDVQGDLKNSKGGINGLSVADGLTVKGVLTRINQLRLSGDIANDTGGAVKISDDLDATGLIFNSVAANNGGKVVINDDVLVTGSSTTNGSSTVGGSLNVSGKSTLSGNLWVKDANSLTVGYQYTNQVKLDKNEIVSTGPLNINSNGQKVVVGGSTAGTKSDLSVTGNTAVGGILSVTGNATVGGVLNVTGKISSDSPSFTGDLSSQRIKTSDYGHFNRLFFDYASGLGNYALNAYESYIYNDNNQVNINDDNFFIHAPNAIKLENPNGWARLKYDGNFESGKGMKINGVATAQRFGTFKRVISAFLSVPANSYAEASQACPAGTFIVSCSGQGSNSSSYSATGNISFSNLDPYNNTCYARGVNNSGSTKYVAAIATCMDPAN